MYFIWIIKKWINNEYHFNSREDITKMGQGYILCKYCIDFLYLLVSNVFKMANCRVCSHKYRWKGFFLDFMSDDDAEIDFDRGAFLFLIYQVHRNIPERRE